MAIGQCNVALFYFCNVATVVGRLNENIKVTARKILEKFRNSEGCLGIVQTNKSGSEIKNINIV